jgi:hypothetical protein
MNKDNNFPLHTAAYEFFLLSGKPEDALKILLDAWNTHCCQLGDSLRARHEREIREQEEMANRGQALLMQKPTLSEQLRALRERESQ